MQPRVDQFDHKIVGSPDKSGTVRPQHRPSDWKAIEELLGLFARAVQQLHTYPLTSPLCVAAIDACHRALAALDSRDQLTLRVTPTELIVDDIPVGQGTQVGTELAKRLHRASVAAVTVERGASPREIGRFCEDLLRCGDNAASELTLLEMVTEHGIDRVTVEMASRPEVLQIDTIAADVSEDLARERVRFETQLAKGGAVNHLYSPQKGWVRIDPAGAPPIVSLLDLAVLADSPAALAAMLLQLTDDAADTSPAEALERKYSDVAMLISSLDPRVARRMFGKLARAVLDLEPASRQSLLRKTVLPGLLDGRVGGTILRDFPDVDLAESLCLLLDLETAAPELLTTALSRLELSPERHAAVVPLLDQRLRAREAAAEQSARQTTLARHARELVRVEGASGKSFAEFAAFDLSIDTDAAATLAQVRSLIPASDLVAGRLTCLWHLICLEPNPEAVTGFLNRSFALLAELEAAGRGGELPGWLAAYRGLAERVGDSRPDVAGVIVMALSAFCTPERAAWIVDLSRCEPGGPGAAAAVIDALGPAVAAPFVELLERESAAEAAPRGGHGRARAVAQLLGDHAALVAPAVAPLLQHRAPAVLRTLLRVLAAAGPGYEDAIAAHVAGDEPTAREALRALARVGTPRAAGFVVAEIVRQQGTLSAAAEETLWHFPPGEAQRRTRELLARREFTIGHPQAAERLLDRAARAGAVDLQPVLAGLASLRFRIWSPAVARVARKANAMLKAPPRAQTHP